MNFEDDH